MSLVTPGRISPHSLLANHHVALIVIGVLVDRSGGQVCITQAEIDAVQHRTLDDAVEVGMLTLTLSAEMPLKPPS